MATSYHFDFGNSTDGPIGFCARILADSREEALTTLRDRLMGHTSRGDCNIWGDGEEYIEVYFGIDNLTTAAIDEEGDPETGD